MKKVDVTINGKKGQVDAGCSVLEAAKQIGAGMAHACLGNCLCSTCRMCVIEGKESLNEKSQKETVCLNYHFSFDEGIRLGCQAKIEGPGPVVLKAPIPFGTLRPPHKKNKLRK